MKTRDSQIVKGIAILMMLFHHLFALKKFSLFNITHLIINQKVTTDISSFFKVCVFLFVFVSAYGISIQLSKSNCSLKQLEPITFKRIFNMAKRTFALIVFIFVVGSIFNLPPYSASTSFNSGNFIQKIVYIFFNTIGMCQVLKVPILNIGWWYLTLAILLILLVPVLYKLLDKIGAFSLLMLTIFSYYAFSFDTTSDQLPKYLLIALLGIITANYNFFELLRNFLVNRFLLRFLIIIYLLLYFPIAIYLRQFINPYHHFILFTISAFNMVCLCFLFISHIPVISTILFYLGKYSLYMWLFHTYIMTIWFSKFTYSFENLWLIYFMLILTSFVFSFIFTNLVNFIDRKLVKLTSCIYKHLHN